MQKLITIIIATYNAEKTLERCLNSVVPQLSEQCELIIIDGGSKDLTTDIIMKYKSYITYTHSEPDKGIYDAWNKGIKQSNGSWLMFIGADDELLPHSISSYLEILNKTDAIDTYDYICASNDYIKQDGTFIKKIGEEPSWKNMRKYMAAAHVASLHNRKNLFGQIGMYDLHYSICADYELLLRKKNKLKYMFMGDFTVARMRAGGMSMSNRAIVETYKIRRRHKTINTLLNNLILIKSLLLYKFFIIHK